ncbi:winged helix-turn-helix domain-containing protein [Nonomuraea sp. NBC_01738]|uniref:BTAD domain-containing putative transcriptional regulator n=1 Tax=Nonomuraea sp. NBC_01738 TaxID=2976003 RepID=UPI002E10F68A|nr:winged helix-turn-helix domain-containing protein [Nonomuraea sp. NBC_01738]
MRLEILGPPRALGGDGLEIALGGPRGRALLVLLALSPGRVVPAERLIDDLYGTRPPDGVANALQSQVSRLRRTLGRELVEFHPAGYRLAVEPALVDASVFEELAGRGAAALAAGDPAGAAGLLREALALWRGEPLAGVPLDDSSQARAAFARLAELRLTVLEDRVQADLDLGGHREVIAELRALVAEHPLRERPRAQLMRALHADGRQADALSAYEEGRRALDDELGVLPGRELTQAHLSVLRSEPAAVTAVRRGVRVPFTTLVGRDEELAAVGDLLARARLVTLVGPGGAGKTRLAVEAAGRAAGDVCFAELAAVTDADDLTGALLSALGIRDRPQVERRPGGLGPGGGQRVGPFATAAPVDRLVAALGGRNSLLVLDNCEHLVAPVAELAEHLLGACPGLRVLATSREALGIIGETLVPVSPLELPPPAAADPLGYAAVRLFADRAAAVRRDFAPGEEELAQVAAICRALDGLPLAIELAAARLRTLSVADVAARLDDRFRLLTRGSRTALPRHQTLRAVVAWSWDLLDPDEQVLARRLAVFGGGGRVEAAELVCGLPEDILTSLADKSLVELSGGRFRVLRTISAFLGEKLAEAGEVDAVRQAHLAYCLDLAAEADGKVRTGEQLHWLALLDEESDGLHAAVRWATESGREEQALRLVARLACYWWMRGRRVVSANLSGSLLARLGEVAPDGLEEEYAMCVLCASADGRADEPARRRLAGLDPLGPLASLPVRLEFLMMLLPLFTGPPDGLTAGALNPPEDLPLTPWARALTRIGTAFLHLNQGETASAGASFERAVADFRVIGERWGAMLALGGLQELTYQQGDHAASFALADQALVMAVELGSDAEAAEILCRRADCVVHLGELADAEAGYLLAAEQAARTGALEIVARAHLGLGLTARMRGRAGEAVAYFERALAECPQGWYGAEDVRGRILAELGDQTGSRS